MTLGQLKNLRLEDFQAPNQVLCYGAGLMGRLLVDSYRRAGVHVAGFIDKNKQGTVETESGALPVYSIDAAVNAFGKEMKVVLTIANTNYFPEIEADLTAVGVSAEHIYDWSFFSWITVPSPKCYCKHLFGRTVLLSGAITQCCFWGENRVFNVETLDPNVPPEQTVREYIQKLQHYRVRAMAGEVPAYCAGCPNLEDHFVGDRLQLDVVGFSASAHCNAECIYCTAILETEIKKLPYDAKGYGELFLEILRSLDAGGYLAPGANISLAGGELSVSPVREPLVNFALTHPNYQYTVLSNCAVYREGIARMLSQNSVNEIMCDLDAGTPETYLLMKGFNYFDKVEENLKKYARHGRVVLKYIVMPGFNTAMDDYLGTIRILEELGLTELLLSQDHLHTMDLYTERKSLFEVARFRKLLKEHGINGVLFGDSFSERQTRMVDRFYKQMS